MLAAVDLLKVILSKRRRNERVGKILHQLREGNKLKLHLKDEAEIQLFMLNRISKWRTKASSVFEEKKTFNRIEFIRVKGKSNGAENAEQQTKILSCKINGAKSPTQRTNNPL